MTSRGMPSGRPPGPRTGHWNRLIAYWKYEDAINKSLLNAFSAATWAEVFLKAGWELPPPPQATYVQIDSAVYKVFGEAREHLAVASSNEVATLIAKALNALRVKPAA